MRDANNASKDGTNNPLTDICTVLDTTQTQSETIYTKNEVGHDSSPLLMILFVLVGIPVIFTAIVAIYYKFFGRKDKEGDTTIK
ncbi:MAG: hypothetical protein MJZ02_04120 [Paludibacteraceae bacterium]|nr:hypothetical protein [Paludibacteraceae bacterium]